MNSYSVIFNGSKPQDYIEIWYLNIDYFITFSGRQYVVVRGSWWGWLMDQSMEGTKVKTKLSNFVQGKSLWRPEKLEFPKQGIILSHEHGRSWEEAYVIFKPSKTGPDDLQMTMKTKINWILTAKETFVLMHPQTELFDARVLPPKSQKVIYVSEKDMNSLRNLIAAIGKVQRKFYQKFTV
jgi:hypothetical protein